MRKIVLVIITLIQITICFSQDSSAIEKKYSFIEIWGLKDQTKEEFLEEITSYPEGICQQSLVQMGYTDANKIPIPFTNNIIITTRNAPKHTNAPTIQVDYSTGQWLNYVSEFEALGVYERQQVPQFLNHYINDNHHAMDNLFNKLQIEFTEYGIHLKKEKIIQAIELYKKYAKLFSKKEIIHHINTNANTETLSDAAIFLAPEHLKSESDLLDFMPLLLKKASGVQSLLTVFINKNMDINIDWSKHMNLVTKLLNNPNPFQCSLTLRILDHSGFTKENFTTLLSKEMMTFKEILKSKYIPREYPDYLIVFLNKYSSKPIETDWKLILN